MSLSLVTAPATEPVTLAAAKTHLRVDSDYDDELISFLIVAAREYGEVFTRRAFITQCWDDQRHAFPCGGEPIWLEKPPLQLGTDLAPTPPVVTYVDSEGVTQTWSATRYTIDAPVGPTARRACLVPNYGQVYPSTRDVVAAVTIRFWAGYGNAAAVPKLLTFCLKEHMRAAELRSDPEASQQILRWVSAQLWPFKSF